jgi:2-polyprenyl-6-methoxyphenol hydroxylase-like FAD-dependent oxidoreductase
MTPREPARVVIVGAGPAGMVLAYLLARCGGGSTKRIDERHRAAPTQQTHRHHAQCPYRMK